MEEPQRTSKKTKNKIKTEPISAYAAFIREEKKRVGTMRKLNMQEMHSIWKTMSDYLKAPFKEMAIQEKRLLIENGTYRLNRKKTSKKKKLINMSSNVDNNAFKIPNSSCETLDKLFGDVATFKPPSEHTDEGTIQSDEDIDPLIYVKTECIHEGMIKSDKDIEPLENGYTYEGMIESKEVLQSIKEEIIKNAEQEIVEAFSNMDANSSLSEYSPQPTFKKTKKKIKMNKIKTEPLSPYAAFIREEKIKVGKLVKLDMQEMHAQWTTMSEHEKAPFKEMAIQEKKFLIENGTYRNNRKKKEVKSKEVKNKEKRIRRVKEKNKQIREKETSLAIIETLTNNNKNLSETISILSTEVIEERRKKESFQKIAMDSQKSTNYWKEKFIAIMEKYEA